jgi:hypothetical protein
MVSYRLFSIINMYYFGKREKCHLEKKITDLYDSLKSKWMFWTKALKFYEDYPYKWKACIAKGNSYRKTIIQIIIENQYPRAALFLHSDLLVEPISKPHEDLLTENCP